MNGNYKRLEEEVIYLKSHEIKLADADRNIKSLNATLDGLRKELSRWEDKYKAIDARARELDGSCFSLTQDKDKLTSMLRSKTTELEEFRMRTSKLEQDSYRARELEANYNETLVQMIADAEPPEHVHGINRKARKGLPRSGSRAR